MYVKIDARLKGGRKPQMYRCRAVASGVVGGGGRGGWNRSQVVDGFVFCRLYFGYSDLQLFAIFIFEVVFFGDISCDKC